jgi:Putative transposase
MTLDVAEFIRRFLIHVLPKGFHRIRHYAATPGRLSQRTSALLSPAQDCSAAASVMLSAMRASQRPAVMLVNSFAGMF